MALPIKWSLPSLSEITSPSAGFPNTLSTSLENTQSCPCKIRARGLTTIPAIDAIQGSTFGLAAQGDAVIGTCISSATTDQFNPSDLRRSDVPGSTLNTWNSLQPGKGGVTGFLKTFR